MPEIAVTEAALEADAAEDAEAEAEAEADAEADADEDAEPLALAAPQSGEVLRVTPLLLQRLVAKPMVAGYCISDVSLNLFLGCSL